MPPRSTSTELDGSRLLELSNAMVALHRRHFGRGPAEAKSVIAGGLAVCVLSDIFTPAERQLIDAGRDEHVQLTRMLHQNTCEDEYKRAAAEALGRPVLAQTCSVHIGPDLAVEVFVLGRSEPAGGDGDGSGS